MTIRTEEALTRLRAAVVMAVQDGAEAGEIRQAVEAGLAEAEAVRPRGAEALAEYRDRFRHAA
jgi:hypothetical protein